MNEVLLVHLGDTHFGRDADLAQLEELESLVPSLNPGAIVLSGDVTQRARHGEFQAARAFVRRLEEAAPALVLPGNHDVQWWRSPFGLGGQRVKYAKYRAYFGEVLAPAIRIPGAVIAGVLSSYGVSFGSMTLNLNDLAVKGHLPKSEIERVRGVFQRAPADAAKIVVLHHNLLRGALSHRMGLARWATAQRRLLGLKADVVLCGHDHQEGAGQVDGKLTVSTAGTHTTRTRGDRPSVFNVVRINDTWIQIEHHRWDSTERRFRRADLAAFARAGHEAAPVPRPSNAGQAS